MASFSPRGAGRTTNEISYLQPLKNLSSEQMVQLLEEQHIATDDCLSAGELYARALKHNLTVRLFKSPPVRAPVGHKRRRTQGMLHVGQAAIVAKAREMLVVMSRLDRQIAFRPGSELGLMLAQANEWAVVKATPPKWETKVRVGDALAAVDDHATLLKTYEDMFALVVAAKRSKLPYTLTFRRAPFHRGWLYKKPKAGRGKEEGFFSGMTGWKKRYFVLAYGVLAYYDDKAECGGKHKGFYTLQNSNNHQCLVTSAPAQHMSKGDKEPGLMLVKGDERLVLKSASTPSDIHNWAALLYIAIAHANGGNDLLRGVEAERLNRLDKLKQAKAAKKNKATANNAESQPPAAAPEAPHADDDDAGLTAARPDWETNDDDAEDDVPRLLQDASDQMSSLSLTAPPSADGEELTLAF